MYLVWHIYPNSQISECACYSTSQFGFESRPENAIAILSSTCISFLFRYSVYSNSRRGFLIIRPACIATGVGESSRLGTGCSILGDVSGIRALRGVIAIARGLFGIAVGGSGSSNR